MRRPAGWTTSPRAWGGCARSGCPPRSPARPAPPGPPARPPRGGGARLGGGGGPPCRRRERRPPLRPPATRAGTPSLLVTAWLPSLEEVHRFEQELVHHVPEADVVDRLVVLRSITRLGRPTPTR